MSSIKKERSLLELVKLLHQLGDLTGYRFGLCNKIDSINFWLADIKQPILSDLERLRLYDFIQVSLQELIGVPNTLTGYYWGKGLKEPRQAFLQKLINELEGREIDALLQKLVDEVEQRRKL